MNPSQQQRVTIIFSREQRESIRKALEKLRNSYHNWDYFNGNVGESAFIRDAVTYTAQQILDSKGRGAQIQKQVREVSLLANDLESECGRLRKLLTLKPDRRKAKGRKGCAA